jgi:hypothetical protein
MPNDGREGSALGRELWFAAIPPCVEVGCKVPSSCMVGVNYQAPIYMCEVHALHFAKIHRYPLGGKVTGPDNGK